MERDEERQPLLNGGQGINRATPYRSQESIPVADLLTPAQNSQRWVSIRIMYLTMFISSMAFSICMSSVWPFLTILDHNATATFLGYVVAAYSVGQIIAAPTLGVWATYRGRAKEPLAVSTAIFTVANLLYSYLQDLASTPLQGGYMMILARFLIGVGAGNIAVVRSYLAGATDTKERTPAMANVAMAQALGFVLGPAIQTALVPLGFPGVVEIPGFHLNLYTAPAFLGAVCGVINLLLILFAFTEYDLTSMLKVSETSTSQPDRDGTTQGADGSHGHGHAREDKVDPSNGVAYANNNGVDEKPLVNGSSGVSLAAGSGIKVRPDKWAVLVCITVFFTTLFMFSVFETMSTPLATDMLAMTEKDATLYVGLMFIGSGVLSTLVFLGVKLLAKKVDERLILVVALFICVIGFVPYMPYSSEPVPYKMMTLSFPNGTVIHSNVTTVGCPYSWCENMPTLYFFQIVIASVVMSFGYPSTNLIVNTMYSKVLGPISQGVMMGVLSATGSLGRLVGPLFVTAIYETRGPRDTFIIIGGIVFATGLLVIATYRRLVPYRVYHEARLAQMGL